MIKKAGRYEPSKPLFVWRSTTKEAENVLKACFGLFLIKREQAEIALTFRATVNPRYRRVGVPAAVNDQRQELANKLVVMKKPWKDVA